MCIRDRVKDVPEDKWNDFDYLISMLDWQANVDPEFARSHFTSPHPVHTPEAMHAEGYHENWVVYGSEWFSARELTVYPGRSVTIKDAAAYGVICVQGYGQFGAHQISAPSLIRFGEMTEDEFFVTHTAAAEGVTVRNASSTEPLVLLKHFNPGNSEMPKRHA